MARMSPVTQTICKIVILSIWLLLLEVRIGLGAEPSTGIRESIRKHEEKFTATQGKIEQSTNKVSALEAREKPVDERLEALSQRLNVLYSQENETRSQLAAVRQRLQKARTEHTELEKEVHRLEKDAGRRLVALYKMGNLGVIPVMMSCKSVSEFLRKQKALEAISRHDSALWTTLQEKKRKYESVTRQMAREEEAISALLLQQRREKDQIEKHKGDQVALLAAIRSDKKKTMEYLATLKASAQKLEETIAELKARQDKALRRDIPPGGAFFAAKGVLPPPVKGEVVEPFGPYEINDHYGTKGFRTGIHFRVEPGTPVQAVHGGQVIYADRFKGYGKMVIIDHGDHFYTLCAQLADFSIKNSDSVSAGEIIGIAGGVSTHGGSGVYFEIRHHGKPLDPMPWLLKR